MENKNISVCENKSNTQKLVRASLLLSIAIVFQIIGRNIPEINQFFVGPGINCILILTVLLTDRWLGIVVGILTPLLALLVGQLATALVPFIPFIMIGNILFVYIFSLFKKGEILKRGIGIIIGAITKYAFLTLAATKLINIFNLNFPDKVAKVLVISMGIPQLITALVGGTFALIIMGLLIKRKVV